MRFLRAAMKALADMGLDSLLFLRQSKRGGLVLEDAAPSQLLASLSLSSGFALKSPSIPLHHRLVRAFRRDQVEIAGGEEVNLLVQTLCGKAPDGRPAERGAVFIPLHADIYQGVLVLIGSGIEPSCRPAAEALSALLNGLLAGAERLEQGRRRRPQSEWLYRALAALQQTPLERRALAETALRILKAHPSGALAVVALREGDALEVCDSITQALIRLPPNQAGILGRVLSSGRALIAKDAANQAILGKLAESCPPVVCAAAVPLLAGVEQSEVIGVLSLASETAGQLGEEDIPELEALANCLVVALGGAELLKSTRQALQEQVLTWNTLVEVGRRVTRSLDAEKVAQELLEVLVKLVGAKEGFRVAVNDAHTHLAIVDVLGVPPEEYLGSGRSLQGTLMEWVLQHQQTLWIPDTGIPGWYTPIFSRYTRPVSRNLLMVPVRAGGKIVGALALTNKRPGTFTAQDVQVAEIMASWLSHVQENARLYAQSRRQFERLEATMVRAGQALASGYSLRATLEAIVRTAVELVDGDAGSIDLADPEGKVMRLAASHGFIHECLLPTLPIENSLVGTVFRTGRPLRVDDLLADERVASRVLIQKLGTRSGAFVPLEDDAGRLGALSVMRRHVEPFTDEELQLLHSFAQRAAAAIRTARWREELLRQAETLEAIMRATDDLVIVLDQDGVLEYANPRARSFWPEEAEKSSYSPEVQETLRQLAQRCQRALAGEMDMPFIFPWITPEGRRFDFSVAATSLE
ncbi:MAG: GAF domain-containing protein, partial [Anaerolineae bacterium]